jgi:hypothetical protein
MLMIMYFFCFFFIDIKKNKLIWQHNLKKTKLNETLFIYFIIVILC